MYNPGTKFDSSLPTGFFFASAGFGQVFGKRFLSVANAVRYPFLVESLLGAPILIHWKAALSNL